MEAIKFSVKGMHCAGCENTLKKVLGRLGARNVSADSKKGAVSMEIDPSKTSISEVRTAIQKAGYKVV